jgi:hypothetical protein
MMIGPPVVTKLNRSLRLTRTSEESKDRGLARQLPSYTFPILSMYAESLRPSARVRRHRRSRVPPALSHPRTTSDLVPPGTHLISSYLVSSHLMLSHRIASRLISSYLVLSRLISGRSVLFFLRNRFTRVPAELAALPALETLSFKACPPPYPSLCRARCPLPSPHAPPNVDVSGPGHKEPD